MKRKFFAIIVAVMLAVLVQAGIAVAAETNEVVIQTLTGSVVRPNEQNTVALIGTPGENSPYFHNIRIEIRDKNGKTIQKIKPTITEGYGPSIMLGDFGADEGLEQIFYGASTGGSGGFGYFDLFSVKNNKVRKLFDADEFNKQNRYTGRFLDNYRAEITKVIGKERYIIDLSQRSQEYKDSVWTRDGKLIEPRTVDISGVNTVFPYFNYVTNNFELLVYQRVTGLYNADGLGYVLSQQRYDKSRFETFFSGLMIYPN